MAYPRTCTFVGGMWQYVENRPGGVYVTGQACTPPQTLGNLPTNRIDLCPPEWGGDGSMLLSDARCINPASRVRVVDEESSALLSANDGLSFGIGSGTTLGSTGSTSGSALQRAGVQPMNGGDWGRATFNATLSGCGCGSAPRTTATTTSGSGGTSASTLSTAPRPSWLVWAAIAIVAVAAFRDKR